MELFTIRNIQKDDREWIRRWLIFQWGAEIVISHDTVFHPADLPGFVAIESNTQEPIGLITYIFDGEDCEIVTLNALREGIGVGSMLIEEVKKHAHNVGCRRLVLVTTNDNLNSLRFFQKKGFMMIKINVGASDRARQKKPQIPTIGYYGIPIHDEIELEYKLE